MSDSLQPVKNLLGITVTTAGTRHAGGLAKGFPALFPAKPGDQQRTQGVEATDAGQLKTDACHQQDYREVHAGLRAGYIGQDGRGVQRLADSGLVMNQEPHERNGDH